VVRLPSGCQTRPLMASDSRIMGHIDGGCNRWRSSDQGMIRSAIAHPAGGGYYPGGVFDAVCNPASRSSGGRVFSCPYLPHD